MLATLGTRAKRRNGVVYAVVRRYFRQFRRVRRLHRPRLSTNKMVTDGLSAPTLHPGAAKYYKERRGAEIIL